MTNPPECSHRVWSRNGREGASAAGMLDDVILRKWSVACVSSTWCGHATGRAGEEGLSISGQPHLHLFKHAAWDTEWKRSPAFDTCLFDMSLICFWVLIFRCAKAAVCIAWTRVTYVLQTLNETLTRNDRMHHLVQVEHNLKKTFGVDGLWSPFSIPSSFVLFFVQLPFFLKTKVKMTSLSTNQYSTLQTSPHDQYGNSPLTLALRHGTTPCSVHRACQSCLSDHSIAGIARIRCHVSKCKRRSVHQITVADKRQIGAGNRKTLQWRRVPLARRLAGYHATSTQWPKTSLAEIADRAAVGRAATLRCSSNTAAWRAAGDDVTCGRTCCPCSVCTTSNWRGPSQCVTVPTCKTNNGGERS